MDINFHLAQTVYNDYSALFVKKGYERDYNVTRSAAYFCDSQEALASLSVLANENEIIFDDQGPNGNVNLVFSREDALGMISLGVNNGALNVSTSARTDSDCRKLIKYIRKIVPEKPKAENEDISVKFWYLTASGPYSVHRQITVPLWESIRGNYSAQTLNGLDSLVRNFSPDTNSGKIILWHGVPGTGKTYALRALIREWRNWVVPEYILDPESLFGQSAGYLAEMIFNVPTDEYGDPLNTDKWKLLILEDTGELLTEDAKDRTGQGLSRLLNLADGFIGQGLKTLVLITTNEELDSIHPAVSREGRCAAAIHFAEMSLADAQEWAKNNNLSLPNKNSTWTIADLYALRSNAKIEVVEKPAKSSVGFKMAG